MQFESSIFLLYSYLTRHSCKAEFEQKLNVFAMQLADAQAQHATDLAEMEQLQSQMQELQMAVSQAVDELEGQVAIDTQQKSDLEELRKLLQAKDAELAGLKSAEIRHEVRAGLNVHFKMQ